MRLSAYSMWSIQIASSLSFENGARYGMGWLRSVGSTKLQVSFAEYRLFYEALLQKGPTI